MSSKCKKYDLKGNDLGEVTLAHTSDWKAHSQMLKDYIVALRNNARQWSASTKDKSERAASNIKPHAQKGTGKARQGSIVSPQYRGGGRVHTPKPKFDQHVKINQKERRKAICSLLVEKLVDGNMVILESNLQEDFSEPKTKKAAKFLRSVGMDSKKCLFILDDPSSSEFNQFKKSLRNIPGCSYMFIDNLNGYDLVAHQKVVVLERATEKLSKVMGA